MNETRKICPSCGLELKVSEFRKSKNGSAQLCIVCTKNKYLASVRSKDAKGRKEKSKSEQKSRMGLAIMDAWQIENLRCLGETTMNEFQIRAYPSSPDYVEEAIVNESHFNGLDVKIIVGGKYPLGLIATLERLKERGL